VRAHPRGNTSTKRRPNGAKRREQVDRCRAQLASALHADRRDVAAGRADANADGSAGARVRVADGGVCQVVARPLDEVAGIAEAETFGGLVVRGRVARDRSPGRRDAGQQERAGVGVRE
jgi:hypothetical protein